MNINISDNVLNKSWEEIVKEIATNEAWQEMKRVNITLSSVSNYETYIRETLYLLAKDLQQLVADYLKIRNYPGLPFESLTFKTHLLGGWKNYCILYEVLNNLEK